MSGGKNARAAFSPIQLGANKKTPASAGVSFPTPGFYPASREDLENGRPSGLAYVRGTYELDREHLAVRMSHSYDHPCDPAMP